MTTIIVLVTPFMAFKFFDYLVKASQPEAVEERKEKGRLRLIAKRAAARI